MRVDKIMSRQVATCAPDDSLEHAARLMWENDCGCLPVCRSNGSSAVVGVITDRDICMSAMFQGKTLHELSVDSAMARQVLTCRPDDTLVDAERKMRDAKIRRLPVTDEDGSLLGIVSMADLAREAEKQQNLPRHDISGSEVCSTLAAICAPAGNRPAG